MWDPERVCARLSAGTRFHDVRFLAEVDSTNRYLADLAAAGQAQPGLVVVADVQWAGRGRQGRTWEAAAGTSLLMSVLLDASALVLQDGSSLYPGRLHFLTAALALAGQQAVAEAGGVSPALKWPNDLLVGDRKLAGILAEASGASVVAGLGLNVTDAPPGAACVGPGADRLFLLVAVLEGLERWLSRLDDVAPAYRQACSTLGRRVRVELAGGAELEGVAEDLDPDGRLVVRADDDRRAHVAAGDVTHLRPAEGSW